MCEVIHFRQIIEVNNIEILYKGNDNLLKTINFDECRRNWVNFVNSSDDFEISNLTVENSYCVGWRDYFDDPRYIELFADIGSKLFFLED
jgi:hypothetical protein